MEKKEVKEKKEKEYCFLCLEATKNRICLKCKCYAHPSCYGKFLKTIPSYIYEEGLDYTVILSRQYIGCPVCKEQLRYTHHATRNLTGPVREFIEYHRLLQETMLIYDEENERIKRERAYRLFKHVVSVKSILLKNDEVKIGLMNTLEEMYIKDNWKEATYFHMKIFGRQVSVERYKRRKEREERNQEAGEERREE